MPHPRATPRQKAPVKKTTEGTSPLTRPHPFPEIWTEFMDVRVPHWVKQNYSPREQWKNRPFTRQDALFFLKGVRELSELFTEDRPNRMPNYFSHPKFRSSYLLYFLPLQAAKFFSLFHAHPEAIGQALAHAKLKGVLRVADLGSGPGTASIALLLYLADQFSKNGQDLPRIELEWFDINRGVLEEGKKLVHEMIELIPELKDRVVIQTHARSWTDAARVVQHSTSLVLVGNMLNEEALSLRSMGSRHEDRKGVKKNARSPYRDEREFQETQDIESEDNWSAPEEKQSPMVQSPAFRALSNWIEKAEGGGILIVEPAAKSPARLLSLLRDTLFEADVLPEKPESLWGPCLHAGKCPLSQGRDWCHFSIPSDIPGENFKFFSKGLGSERHWLKFSFLWIAALDSPAKKIKDQHKMRRVISDVIHPPGGSSGIMRDKGMILMCEPEQALRVSSKIARSPQGAPLQRGDLYSPHGQPTPASKSVAPPEKKQERSARIQVKFKGRR